jgi:ATP-binding cassette, subfamily B, bacterial
MNSTRFDVERPPFSLLKDSQKKQVLKSFTELSFSRGQRIWSAQESDVLFVVLQGQVSLRSETCKIASLQPGDWFGNEPGLRGALKAVAADSETIVARWDARDWASGASAELHEYWTQLREGARPPAPTVECDRSEEPAAVPVPKRDRPPASQSSRPRPRREYPFEFCADERTAAACLTMVAQFLRKPVPLSEVRRRLSGEQPKDLERLADKLGLRLRYIHYREPTWAKLRELVFPALIRWKTPERWAVVYAMEGNRLLVADPNNPDKTCEVISKATLDETWNGKLWQAESVSPVENFNLSWLFPAMGRYRGSWLQVIVASLFLQLLGLLSPLLTRIVFDKGINQQNVGLIEVMVVALAIVAVFELGLGISRQLLLEFTVRRLDLSLSAQIFSHLLRLPLTYFEFRTVGDTVARVQELEKVRQFLTDGLTVCLDSLFALAYVALMFYFSPPLTGVALATIVLFLLLIFASTPIVRRAWSETLDRRSKTQSALVEAISSVQSLKAHTAEKHVRDRWEKLFGDYVEQSFKASKIATLSGKAGDFIKNASDALILLVGAKLVIDRQLSFGEFIAFQMAAARAIGPLLGLAKFWQRFQQVLLSVDRLKDILDERPETRADAGIEWDNLEGRIQFDGVTFRYPQAQNGKKPRDSVLDDISFVIEPGQFVGIVGESGSGKSTLSKLLMGFYQPESGAILIDGIDLATIDLSCLRRQIGVVLQENILLNASVNENIALCDPYATQSEIVQAAKLARAHDFIVKQPQGYKTLVGERGGRFSGGQRQRIALARFFLSSARLLILDEATSALDVRTERQVLESFRSFFPGRTVVMITHRFAPLKSADLILVLDKGKIVERGTHDELIAKGGVYATLYELQRDSV